MHPNSLEAYRRLDLPASQARVFRVFMINPHESFTDRTVKDMMRADDMNEVRPRITELIERGVVKEYGNTTCPVTNKTVRTVGLVCEPSQPKLI